MSKQTLEQKYQNLSPLCKGCILHSKEQKNGRFKVGCGFIHKDDAIYRDETLRKSMIKKHGVDEGGLVYALSHILRFFEYIVGEVPYWYQKEFLLCDAPEVALLQGRQTGKSFVVAVYFLYECITKPTSVLICAPNENQVGLVYDYIDNFAWVTQPIIKRYLKLNKGQKRSFIQKPHYEMRFKNGSLIRGFTLATESGGKGSSVRGQPLYKPFHMTNGILFVDESDYVVEDDWAALQPIFDNNRSLRGKHARQILASTIKGGSTVFRTAFFDPEVKSMRVPSFEKPGFTQKEYDRAVARFGRDKARREYLVRWEDEETSVFPKWARDQAKDDTILYPRIPVGPASVGYMTLPRRENKEARSLGIDWNKQKHGGRLFVVSGNAKRGLPHYTVEYKETIQDEKFTQLSTVQRIIEVSRYYAPDVIPVDEGYGDTQVELLRSLCSRKDSIDERDRRIPGIIDVVRMNGKMALQDPIDGHHIEKDTKSFLIDTLQRLLEDGRLSISGAEYDIEQGLDRALEQFSIKKVSARGIPIYSQKGDHDVISLALAVYGAAKTMGDKSVFAPGTYAGGGLQIQLGFVSHYKEEKKQIEDDLDKRIVLLEAIERKAGVNGNRKSEILKVGRKGGKFREIAVVTGRQNRFKSSGKFKGKFR